MTGDLQEDIAQAQTKSLAADMDEAVKAAVAAAGKA